MTDTREDTPLLGYATTRELLEEVAVRMEVTQNSTAGRDLGRLARTAVENLDRGVLNYSPVRPTSQVWIADDDPMPMPETVRAAGASDGETRMASPLSPDSMLTPFGQAVCITDLVRRAAEGHVGIAEAHRIAATVFEAIEVRP